MQLSHLFPSFEKLLHMRRKTIAVISWIAVGLLVPLVLLSLTVLVLRIGNFVPEGIDVIFLVPKELSYQAGDGTGVWTTDTQIELFAVSNQNSTGEVTARSDNGDKVIAPGTTGVYRFELKNPGNVALDCKCVLDATFASTAGNFALANFPFSVRLRDYNGNYVLGDENTWVNYSALTNTEHSLTLGKNAFATYDLEWKWDFEGDSDLLDTYFGTGAVQTDFVLTLNIATSAEVAAQAEGTGGISLGGKDPITGGHIDPIPFVILIGAIVAGMTAIVLIYMTHRKKLALGNLFMRLFSRKRRRNFPPKNDL
ncbi:MAG: hypothetical protein IJW55_00250 [Clostridia bacterium]|nr:hypothetical protein [Clostridia bacterium]